MWVFKKAKHNTTNNNNNSNSNNNHRTTGKRTQKSEGRSRKRKKIVSICLGPPIVLWEPLLLFFIFFLFPFFYFFIFAPLSFFFWLIDGAVKVVIIGRRCSIYSRLQSQREREANRRGVDGEQIEGRRQQQNKNAKQTGTTNTLSLRSCRFWTFVVVGLVSWGSIPCCVIKTASSIINGNEPDCLTRESCPSTRYRDLETS